MLVLPLKIQRFTFAGPKTVDLRIRKPSFDFLHQTAVTCCLTGTLPFAFLRTAVSLLTLWFAKAEQPIGLNPLVLSRRQCSLSLGTDGQQIWMVQNSLGQLRQSRLFIQTADCPAGAYWPFEMAIIELIDNSRAFIRKS